MRIPKVILLSLSVVLSVALAGCPDAALPEPPEASLLDADTAGTDGTAGSKAPGGGAAEGAGGAASDAVGGSQGGGAAAPAEGDQAGGDAGSADSPADAPADSPAGSDPLAGVDWNKDIRVGFDPYEGSFYFASDSSGKGTQNPYYIYVKPGPVSEPPAPWKEGHKFVGWYTDYNTWQNKWDFNNMVLENTTLYACHVESAEPDEKPAAAKVDPESKIYDMGLKPTPIADLDAGKDTKTLWVTGVSEDGGWEDHRQYTNNCWGTTASQMLDWFFRQDQFKGVLAQNSSAPKTIDETRRWFLDYRGEWPWMVDSALLTYFDKLFGGKGLDRHVSSYSNPGGSKAFSLDTLSALLYRHLSSGDMGGLTALMFANQPHAMSVWGAEFDSGGQVVALWLTTSECTDDEEVLRPRLNRYERVSHHTDEGRYHWKTSFSYTSAAGGYDSTHVTSIVDIYGLYFLSVAGTQQ